MFHLASDSIKSVFSDNWRYNLLAAWHKILGNLANRVRLEKFGEDFLVLGVYDSNWMQELYFQKVDILQKINEYLGEKKIKELKFKLVKKSSNLKLNLLPKFETEGFNIVERKLNVKENELLSKFLDCELRECLKKFLFKLDVIKKE